MKVNCYICQIEFDKHPSKIAKNITGKFFCSKSCYSSFMTSQKGKWNENHKTLADKEHYNKTKKLRLENTKFCIHCKTTTSVNVYNRFHGENCKHNNFDLMLINLNDFDDYKEFIRDIRNSFIRYHLIKNENNILQTAKRLNIERSHVYNLLSHKTNIESIITTVSKTNLKNYNTEVIIAKNKDFLKETKIKKAKEEYIKLSEEELYTSMLPQYLYYMNIKESEYDESDLIRLPLLIQHYKEINAEDKVEDLEEILEIIKNKL
jgi:hypothetical protein